MAQGILYRLSGGLALSCFLGVAIFGGINSSMKEGKNIASYQERIHKAAQQVLRKYDVNHDGMANPSEIVAIAREIGLEEVMPTENLVIGFIGFPQRENRGDVGVRISCPGSDTYGLAQGSPVFDRVVEMPLTKLEDMAKSSP